MNFGFLIDNRKCIGCHACSTACKAENEVPLGVNRTWVKYVETGLFPDARRHFQVTRCNHCANPPCVRICPVTAMYQRGDGIVEFDSSRCIGCKACLQACPYDAIYIDPDTHTAAKCHYCSHRTDLGLEPACVVVCPEHAIIAGDMADPGSEISRLLARHRVTVRKPEQGTAPKLFYIEGNDFALHPTATERTPVTFLWADVIPLHPAPAAPRHTAAPFLAAAARPQSQGAGAAGPIQIGGSRVAEQMVQTSYNAQHRVPWHWPVPAYLVTKGIGSGLFMVLSLGLGLGLFGFEAATAVAIGFLSLLCMGVTAGLLVYDLERPDRFIYVLTRPQWRSWLTRGAYILLAFGVVAGAWWLTEAAALLGWVQPQMAAAVRPLGLWLGFPLAVGAAIYTAFLFGQAEGRDLWQSTVLPWHLAVQALLAGSAALLLLGLALPLPPDLLRVTTATFATSLVVSLFVIVAGEFGMSHASEVAARAAHTVRHGAYRRHFGWGAIAVGHVAPLALLWIGWPPASALAGAGAIAGLYFFEYAFVMAPQEIPNS